MQSYFHVVTNTRRIAVSLSGADAGSSKADLDSLERCKTPNRCETTSSRTSGSSPTSVASNGHGARESTATSQKSNSDSLRTLEARAFGSVDDPIRCAIQALSRVSPRRSSYFFLRVLASTRSASDWSRTSMETHRIDAGTVKGELDDSLLLLDVQRGSGSFRVVHPAGLR